MKTGCYAHTPMHGAKQKNPPGLMTHQKRHETRLGQLESGLMRYEKDTTRMVGAMDTKGLTYASVVGW
jgi:hypothetical protein